MLVYRAISFPETNTGPYVIQIPNFEIRNVGGIRTVHQVGWCEIDPQREVTRRGAIFFCGSLTSGEVVRGRASIPASFRRASPWAVRGGLATSAHVARQRWNMAVVGTHTSSWSTRRL